jgi:asparagine synthase (glutamine-hydrolysing)
VSAIVGVVRLERGGVSADLLNSMLTTMPHRCPDGRGVWAEGPVGLGHGMMHTTEESVHESLPAVSADSRYVLTAHARVDNRAEWLAETELDDDSPDSALILAAYERWGTACLPRLVGDFAFALWDSTERELLLVRDPLGMNPLFYTYQPGGVFAFASEPRALLTLPEVHRRLNEVRIGDYLAGITEGVADTIYEGILRLPAAHALRLRDGHASVWRYDSITPSAAAAGLSDEAAVARFRELFVEAVRCRMRSVRPVGSQLSGGLDSSSVTVIARDLARQAGKEPVHTFSLVFPEIASSDERPYIEAALAGGGVVPHYVNGDELSPLGNVKEVYRGLDDSLIGGTQHFVWGLLKAAQGAGVRVVLDGFDGDTTVDHGLLRLTELARSGDWEVFAAEIRALISRYQNVDHAQDFETNLGSGRALLSRFAISVLQEHAEEGRVIAFARGVNALQQEFGLDRIALWKRYGKKFLVPPPVRRWRRRWRSRNQPSNVLPPLISEAFAARVGLSERINRYGRDMDLRFDAVRDLQYQLISSDKLASALETTNQLGALLGLEVRHPFMDRRLVEFVLGLPSRLSLHDGWTRYVLRAALDGALPASICWRIGKADMTPSVDGGLLGRDREDLLEAFAPASPIRPYLDERVLARQLEHVADLPISERVQLTRIAILSMWLNLSFQGMNSSGGPEASPGAPRGHPLEEAAPRGV